MSAKNRKEEQQGIQPDPQSVVRMAADLRNLLRYHRQLRIGPYPASSDLSFQCQAGKAEQAGPPRRKEKRAGRVAPLPIAKESLDDLYRQIHACNICSVHSNIPLKVPEQRPGTIKLMVVGDYCVEKNAQGEPYLFGKEEDTMLVRMVEALGLNMSQVYVTNCIKCFCHPEALPGQEDTTHCLSFLAREVAVVRPPVICAMGELSARILVGVNKPLIRLRGTFHKYRYHEQYPVEVMPTFHPRFLLAHEEMKRATWSDLLQIQHRFLTGSNPQ